MIHRLFEIKIWARVFFPSSDIFYEPRKIMFRSFLILCILHAMYGGRFDDFMSELNSFHGQYHIQDVSESKSPFCPIDLCQTTKGLLTSLNKPRAFAACFPQRRYCGHCPKRTEFNAYTSQCVPSTKSTVANGYPECPVQLCGDTKGMYRFSQSPYTFLACSQKVKFCVTCPRSMELDYQNLTCVTSEKATIESNGPDLTGSVVTKFQMLDEIANMHTVAHLSPSDMQASACSDCPIDRCFGFHGIYILPDTTIIVCTKTKRFCARCPKNSEFDVIRKICVHSSTNHGDCDIDRSCANKSNTKNQTMLISTGMENRFQICNSQGAAMCGFCPKGTKFDWRSLNCIRKFSCNKFQCPEERNQVNDSMVYPNPFKPCSQAFYVCIRGSPHPMELTCPQNLFYDPKEKKCLQKEKIDVCKGNLEPEDSEGSVDRQGIVTRSRNCLGRCLAAGDDARVCMYICFRRG